MKKLTLKEKVALVFIHITVIVLLAILVEKESNIRKSTNVHQKVEISNI